ncbi:MAG: mannose-1-phosphate guanylyltransferase/mannose-6-phosphate isomerase [Thermodesulfobacteriota bacterium]
MITNKEYKFYVQSDLREVDHIILEPESRNTAPAIALGMKYCLEKIGCDEDEVIFISPSDHIIRPVGQFDKYFRLAEEIARKDHLIVTFGVKPTRPETGYGYIKTGNKKNQINQRNQNYLIVERFVEKPDSETAKRYLNEGDYYWNSGMFAFQIRTMMEEFERYVPSIRKMLERSFDEMVTQFSKMPEISLDYAVMEKSNRVVLLPLDLYWSDIGSWDSLHEILSCDKDGNAVVGDVMTIDTKNCLIFGGRRLLTTIGLEECLIVDTADAVLISKKGATPKVREIVQRLKEGHRKEAEEHTTTYRPWGNYTVLEKGPRYKIKRVVVNPGSKLSLQTHAHRSEHWVVVKGTAKVTIGEKEVSLHENESAYVPKSTLHRLENGGKIPLEVIEIQNGEYLEEDDIERFDDDYGR